MVTDKRQRRGGRGGSNGIIIEKYVNYGIDATCCCSAAVVVNTFTSPASARSPGPIFQVLIEPKEISRLFCSFGYANLLTSRQLRTIRDAVKLIARAPSQVLQKKQAK
jgi:hypothetical protein